MNFYSFTNLVGIFLAGLLGVFLFLLFLENKMPRYIGCGTVSCGVVYPEIPFDENIDIEQGKTLFKNYCASCHNKNMISDMTGPALVGVEKRWADYPQEDLYNWIRNSQAMIDQKHPRALELWEAWTPVVMTSFPAMTDEQIEDVIAYIEMRYY